MGVFNRPTFIVYALTPVLYWLLYGLENCHSWKQAISFIFSRAFTLIKFTVPLLLLLVLIDTCYYLNIQDLATFIDLVYNERRFIITPLNFIIYNTNTDNLKSHGAHPFYLHGLVNCVLLFGINHLIMVFIFGKFFFQLINHAQWSREQEQEDSVTSTVGKYTLKQIKHIVAILYEQIINNRLCFLMFSFLVPLCLLSFISHQEARFLLPLIIPVCLLTSHCIFGSESYWPLRSIWILFNVTMIILFGYLHQGGMVASLNYAQKMFTHPSNLELDLHVVYYQTYMPPNYLTLAPFSVNILQNKRYLYERQRKKRLEQEENTNLGFSMYKNTDEKPLRKVYDLTASASLEKLNELLAQIKTNYTNVESGGRVRKDFAIFLITPAVLDSRLYKPDNVCSLKIKSDIGFQLQTAFRFHISFEHLKAHFNLANCKFKNNECYLNNCLAKSLPERFFDSFSLNFYQVIL